MGGRQVSRGNSKIKAGKRRNIRIKGSHRRPTMFVSQAKRYESRVQVNQSAGQRPITKESVGAVREHVQGALQFAQGLLGTSQDRSVKPVPPTPTNVTSPLPWYLKPVPPTPINYTIQFTSPPLSEGYHTTIGMEIEARMEAMAKRYKWLGVVCKLTKVDPDSMKTVTRTMGKNYNPLGTGL